jgi:hypothetical protein
MRCGIRSASNNGVMHSVSSDNARVLFALHRSCCRIGTALHWYIRFRGFQYIIEVYNTYNNRR